MLATDSNVKRVLQQMHALAVNDLAARPPKPYALGVAISFIATILAITKQLADAGRLDRATEDAQRAVVAAAVGDRSLNVTLSVAARRDDGDQHNADYRHLRNCFAHVNWHYDETTISPAALSVTLEDWQDQPHRKTFAATIELPALVDLAEKLLVETFNRMS